MKATTNKPALTLEDATVLLPELIRQLAQELANTNSLLKASDKLPEDAEFGLMSRQTYTLAELVEWAQSSVVVADSAAARMLEEEEPDDEGEPEEPDDEGEPEEPEVEPLDLITAAVPTSAIVNRTLEAADGSSSTVARTCKLKGERMAVTEDGVYHPLSGLYLDDEDGMIRTLEAWRAEHEQGEEPEGEEEEPDDTPAPSSRKHGGAVPRNTQGDATPRTSRATGGKPWIHSATGAILVTRLDRTGHTVNVMPKPGMEVVLIKGSSTKVAKLSKRQPDGCWSTAGGVMLDPAHLVKFTGKPSDFPELEDLAGRVIYQEKVTAADIKTA